MGTIALKCTLEKGKLLALPKYLKIMNKVTDKVLDLNVFLVKGELWCRRPKVALETSE